MKRADVIDEARQWVGTPFHHHACMRGVGCDCLGLVYGVAVNLGLTDVEALPAYGREPDGAQLESGLMRELVKVPNKDMQPADILLFRFQKYPQHVGLYTGKTVIHSYQNVGKCTEHRLDDKWRKRHIATYRFKAFV